MSEEENEVLLIIFQGETFYPPPIDFVDENRNVISLVGYSAFMTFWNWENGVRTEVMQASTENGQLAITEWGAIQPNIPFSVITPLAPCEGEWDLFVLSPSNISTRLTGGKFVIPESSAGL